jgi:hypothetical protein
VKLFYGEKLVSENGYLANNKNTIYSGKKLLLLSDKNYTKILLGNQSKFVFWGKIFAAIKNNGKYDLIDMEKNGEKILKKLFSKPNLSKIIPKIEGDYVGCIIKENEEAVVFADNFNRKDVFYTTTKNGTIASTDLSSVVSKGKKGYDQAAIANLLNIYGNYAPKKHTIYKNVKRLGIGERIVFSKDKAQIQKIPFSPDKIADYGEEKLEEYVKLLEEAIKIRGAKNTNWIYLSSGWDSTSLLALMVKNFGKDHVKAIIGQMIYSKRSGVGNRFEIARAKSFTNYYGVDIEIASIDYTKKESVKHWVKIKPYLRDNHLYSDNTCNLFLLSERLKKVASLDDSFFCGEMSDASHNLGFAQFTTILEHPVYEFREYSDKMASYLFGPTFYRSIVDGSYSNDAVYKLLRSRLQGHKFDDEKRLNEKERKTRFVESFFLRNRRIPFYSMENEKSLTKKGLESYEKEMVDIYLKECIDSLKPETIYSWILHLYNSFHWQGSTVKCYPYTAAFNNFHLSFPFWDFRLQKFFYKMPENWGRGLELKPTKYPLKWMLDNKIDYPRHLQKGPHSYIYDVDPNFSFKTELLYYSALKSYYQNAVKDYPYEEILDKNYFDLDYYRKLVDKYLAGIEVTGSELNNLHHLVFLCWIGWY